MEGYYFLKLDRGCNDSILATLNRQPATVSQYNIKQDIFYCFCYEKAIVKTQKHTFSGSITQDFLQRLLSRTK